VIYRVLGLPEVVVTVSTTITPLNSARAETEISARPSGVIEFRYAGGQVEEGGWG
jgi:hypothetical protein